MLSFGIFPVQYKLAAAASGESADMAGAVRQDDAHDIAAKRFNTLLVNRINGS